MELPNFGSLTLSTSPTGMVVDDDGKAEFDRIFGDESDEEEESSALTKDETDDSILDDAFDKYDSMTPDERWFFVQDINEQEANPATERKMALVKQQFIQRGIVEPRLGGATQVQAREVADEEEAREDALAAIWVKTFSEEGKAKNKKKPATNTKNKKKLATKADNQGTSATDTEPQAETTAVPDTYLLPVPGPWTREKLYIAQTRLTGANGERLDEYGLFAFDDIEAGSYIGAYSGTFMLAKTFITQAKQKKAMKRHAVQLVFDKVDGRQDDSRMLFIMPDEHAGTDFVREHPVQMINEPPENGIANTFLFQQRFEREVNTGYLTDNQYYSAVLVYATTMVPAHQELYIHYGDEYAAVRKANNYKVGLPAPKSEAAFHPSPSDVIENILKVTDDNPLSDDGQILFQETDWAAVRADEESNPKRKSSKKAKK